jgi:hypothetical protein
MLQLLPASKPLHKRLSCVGPSRTHIRCHPLLQDVVFQQCVVQADPKAYAGDIAHGAKQTPRNAAGQNACRPATVTVAVAVSTLLCC